MSRITSLTVVAFVVSALGAVAKGQVVSQVVYYPTVPTVVPAPVVPAAPMVAPQTVIVQRPVVAPQPQVVYRPVVPTTYVVPQPYVVARPMVAPTPVVAPAPVAAAAPLVATPVTVVRHRPILGGTVTRTYYRYQPAPVVAAPVAVPAY